ncbi:hypothetical protein BJ508DRAFT_311409 [Ascobolus immersus RN42]|uniref:H-type lectin domain-containing protein n=1 Tax=Ascobolus immersus RN42 TaxID=1160509 RepID=A0A3N4HW53_ASCIM|nr:hypothetical protein BJ508DRAFT_311409 [Ascobolus immersus RN42]
MSESSRTSGESTPTYNGACTPCTTILGSEASFPEFIICTHKEPETDEDILQRILELRQKLSEPQRAALPPFPDVRKQHPAIGSISGLPTWLTPIIRDNTVQQYVTYVTSREVSISKPAIIPAICEFSCPQRDHADVNLFVSAIAQRDEGFHVQVARPNGSAMKNVGINWLELPEEHTRSGLWHHGILSVKPYMAPTGRRVKEYTVNFKTPFRDIPKVLVWITGMHAEGNKRLSVECGVRNEKVSNSAFVLRIEAGTEDTAILHSIELSWVAYDPSLKGVHSSFVTTDVIRTDAHPQHFNKDYSAFPMGKFTKAPKVMVGLSKLDLAALRSHDQNIKLSATDINHLGFCWNANSSGSTVNHGLGLAYLAIESWKE